MIGSRTFMLMLAKSLVPVLVGDGEFLAAVAAACGKHPAAVGGGHPLAEAVLVDPLAA